MKFIEPEQKTKLLSFYNGSEEEVNKIRKVLMHDEKIVFCDFYRTFAILLSNFGSTFMTTQGNWYTCDSKFEIVDKIKIFRRGKMILHNELLDQLIHRLTYGNIEKCILYASTFNEMPNDSVTDIIEYIKLLTITLDLCEEQMCSAIEKQLGIDNYFIDHNAQNEAMRKKIVEIDLQCKKRNDQVKNMREEYENTLRDLTLSEEIFESRLKFFNDSQNNVEKAHTEDNTKYFSNHRESVILSNTIHSQNDTSYKLSLKMRKIIDDNSKMIQSLELNKQYLDEVYLDACKQTNDYENEMKQLELTEKEYQHKISAIKKELSEINLDQLQITLDSVDKKKIMLEEDKVKFAKYIEELND
jgi:hypothetical protein